MTPPTSTETASARSSGSTKLPAMMPLEPGDHLTRAEFERRYAAMPHIKKAELIEGKVYIASPVRNESHGEPHSELVWWLVGYRVATPGVQSGDNPTVRLDANNEPQPDALLRIDPAHGGQTRTADDDYIEGAPELIAEVSASSASYNLHEKLNVYRRNGVREYIVWRTLDGEIDWFILREGRYEKLAAGEDGIIRSEVFPGLWLAVAAMLQHDLAAVLAVVQRGLQSPEHATFVATLTGQSTP